MVQLTPVARTGGQLLVSRAAPLALICETATATAPLFCSVTVCGALTVPAACGGKVNWLEDTDRDGSREPAPAKAAVSRPPWLLLATLRVPVASPPEVGLNCTAIVHATPGAR